MTNETELFGEPKGDEVVISDPDPRWAQLFDEFRVALADALGEVAVRIDHVGSTAVPGLPAKPVIDIQVSVRDVQDEDAYRGSIESLGCPLRAREQDHRFFRPPSTEERTVHIHVCSHGSPWEHVQLLFVAFLKTHGERAAAYAKTKRHLAARFGTDRMRYTNAKDDFIAETLVLAEEWATETGWRP